MSARIIQGVWGKVEKPELTNERKAALYSKVVDSVRYLVGQISISRDAHRQIDKSKAQYLDTQIHELFKILWRAQQEAPCECWACGRERVVARIETEGVE